MSGADYLYSKNKMHQLILDNFGMHIKLDMVETEYILAKLQHKTIKKKMVLHRAGSICRNIYFVNRGCLRIFNTESNGLEHNILFSPQNWWAVDIASFSEQTPSFYTISALEDTDLFCLSYSVLEDLYIEVPKLERFFRILIQNGFYLYQQRITSNLSKTAEERYAFFQKQYPQLEQRIAQKHIASYLGITPVFLSMIRKRNI